MKLLVLLSVLVACTFASIAPLVQPIRVNEIPPSSRITWGQDAEPFQFPWHAAVYPMTSGGAGLCGGSLIGKQWILTAAQCVQGFKNFEVVLGALNLNKPLYKVATNISFVHPKYNSGNLNNDIALLKLYDKVNENPAMKYVRLPSKEHEGKPLDNLKMTISGFGVTEDGKLADDLQFVDILTIKNTDCEKVYGSEYVIPATICALGDGNNKKGICNGDSGSAMVMKENGVSIQFGIASYGSRKGCGAGEPDGYTRTAPFVSWINEIIGA